MARFVDVRLRRALLGAVAAVRIGAAPAPGEAAALAEIARADQLIVCDFGAGGGHEDHRVALGMALAQGIRERLFERADVNVLGFAATGALSNDEERGEPGASADRLESARRAHCRWVVTGTVTRAGKGYSLAWALHQTAGAPGLLREEEIPFAVAEAHRAEARVAAALLACIDDVPVGDAGSEQSHLQVPPDVYLEYGRGLLLIRSGDCPGATQLFERLGQARPERMRLLQGLLLSLACSAEGRSSAALARGIVDPLLRWRHLCREAPPLHAQRSEEAEASYIRGVQLDSEEDEEEAATLYDCSLSFSPRHADARFGAWAARANAKRYSLGAEDLLRGLRLAPDSAGARLAVGLCLVIADRAAEARAEIESALALEPAPRERARIEEAFANQEMKAGDVEKARQHVQRGLALLPDDPSLLARAGMIALMEGRISAARGLLGRATSLAPRMADAWVALGTCALVERDADGAIEIRSHPRGTLRLDPPGLDVSIDAIFAGADG